MNDEKPDNISMRIVNNSAVGGDIYYAREKLGVAVWKLATGIDGIKSRLADAYIELAILHESDFPSDLVNDWLQIKSDLTRGKMLYETRVRNGEIVEVPIGLLFSTLRYMRKLKEADIAKRICLLKSNLDLHIKDIQERSD